MSLALLLLRWQARAAVRARNTVHREPKFRSDGKKSGEFVRYTVDDRFIGSGVERADKSLDSIRAAYESALTAVAEEEELLVWRHFPLFTPQVCHLPISLP